MASTARRRELYRVDRVVEAISRVCAALTWASFIALDALISVNAYAAIQRAMSTESITQASAASQCLHRLDATHAKAEPTPQNTSAGIGVIAPGKCENDCDTEGAQIVL